MQDRFKFRVWKGQENRMVYDVTYLNPLILDPAIKEENKHNILMQCTGLKDKNGKLIYENDIVADVLTNKFTINFDEKYLSFLLTNIKTKESMVFYPNIKLEIIGNTFENKELLNEI